MKESTIKMLLILLTVLIGFATLNGCVRAPKVVMHPMSPMHIFAIPKGAQVEWEDDLMFVETDGYFLSEKYLKEVMDVKVERN